MTPGKKGIGINMIGNIIIALIGVGLLIGAVYQGLGIDSDRFFCETYYRGASIFTGQEYHPGLCEGQGDDEVYQEIETEDVETFAVELGRNIVECWNQYEGYYQEEMFCYGLTVSNLEQNLNESYLNRRMEEAGMCPNQIQNNETEHDLGVSDPNTCGDENQIVFNKEEIEQGETIYMEYNITTDEPPKQHIEIY